MCCLCCWWREVSEYLYIPKYAAQLYTIFFYPCLNFFSLQPAPQYLLPLRIHLSSCLKPNGSIALVPCFHDFLERYKKLQSIQNVPICESMFKNQFTSLQRLLLFSAFCLYHGSNMPNALICFVL